MTIGEINLPKTSPILIQNIFKGVNSLEFKRPKIKNNSDKIIKKTLGFSLFIMGHKPTNNKTTKKSMSNGAPHPYIQ